VLREAAAESEPLVVIAVSIEGVRSLDDKGQWELRDWLMQQLGHEMGCKLQSDDLVGRFSDGLFVVVVRRIDIALGQVIAEKILEAVSRNLDEQPGINGAIKLRCGLADVDVRGLAEAQSLEPVLVRALGALRRARSEDRTILTDSVRHPQHTEPALEAGA